MIITRIEGACCKSLRLLGSVLGIAMQHTSSSAGVSSWISASAVSNRQIAGGTFLSHVAAVHGIAACASVHVGSTLASPQTVPSLNRSHVTGGLGSLGSSSRTPALLAAVSACADSYVHAAQHTGMHTAAFQSCSREYLESGHLVKQQPQIRPCSCHVRCTSHQHTAGRSGRCCTRSRLMATTAATGHGHLDAAAEWIADASSGHSSQSSNYNNRMAADSAWHRKRPVEWTQEQKMQVLQAKVFEKWQEDPTSLGVKFNPNLKEQRCTCPECHNGSSGDNSFAVTVTEDAVLWKCFRATCGFKGGVNLIGGPYADSDKALDAATKFCTALNGKQRATAEAANSINDAVMQLQKQADYRPVPGALNPQLRELTDDALRWFEERGISRNTLQRNGIMMADKYCAQSGKVMPHIAFPYKKNGSIVNVKYRAMGVKAFTQSKGGEQIFYGYDDAKGAEQLVIVEGEMDKLAIEEALQLHSQPPEGCRVAVVSVPAGAPGPSSGQMEQKFRFVETCFDLLSSVSRVVLAVDADGPGVLLADELSRRIGREKCWRVTWPTGPADSLCSDAFAKANELETALAAGKPPPFDARQWARKDANEVLMKDGAEVLRAYLLAAAPLPINGLYGFGEFWQQVYDLYQQGPRGLGWGVSTGWESVNACYQVVPGELTIVTGLPNSGKSEWLDALAVNLARQHGWRFALCSLENTPKDHARKLMEKYTGKAFHKASYSIGTARMELKELVDALVWIDSHFHIIRPPPDTMPSIDYILEKARAAVLRYGIQGLIIDPYNELDHRRASGTTETEHVSRLLTKVKRFAQHFDCHVWFVAHPRTQRGLGIGGGTVTLPAPSMYEISGSANFINKADNGIVVHRPHNAAEAGQGDPYTVQLLVRKVRNKLAGKIGDVQLGYDRATGRYLDLLKQ